MNFYREHAKEILALKWMEIEGPIGRYRLKDVLNLTEGVTRGIQKKLFQEGLIGSEGKDGFKITPKGRRWLKERLKRYGIVEIKDVDVDSLKTSKESVVIHLRDQGHKVVKGIEQRDVAIRAGAAGATTVLYWRGGLYLPQGDYLEKISPEASDKLNNSFTLKDNDVLIIGFDDEKARALEGALAASIYTSTNPAKKRPAERNIIPCSKYAELTEDQLKEIREIERKHNIKLVAYY